MHTGRKEAAKILEPSTPTAHVAMSDNRQARTFRMAEAEATENNGQRNSSPRAQSDLIKELFITAKTS